MYKFVVIGGKIRGKEFILEDGENFLVRDPSCELYFPIDGISKKHLSVTVTDDVAYLKDLGSANGTFVNGVLVKNATIKNADKISLPDAIIQVVHVIEKKIIIRKKITKEDGDLDAKGEVPKALPRKIVYYFRHKIMPPFHNLNKDWEWKILLAITLAVCVIVSILFTIRPALKESRRILVNETAARGRQYADEISRLNREVLSKNQLDSIKTDFLSDDPSVASYELFDLKGRIYRPVIKLNEFVSDTFSVKAKNWFRKEKNKNKEKYVTQLSGSEIGIAQKIMSMNLETGMKESIAIIAIRFRPLALRVEKTKSTKAIMEAVVTSLLVAIIFYGIIYFLTFKPIDEIKIQIEEALRGKRRNIESDFLMEELNPLRDSINSVLQRIRELQKDGSETDFEELEEDGPYVDRLGGFLEGAGVAAMVLDSEKNIKRLNLEAEDLTGIRESAAIDNGLLDTAREKGFAAMLIELCDDSANNGGFNQQGEYELQGYRYLIYVNALMGRDNFAKAFYITFVRE